MGTHGIWLGVIIIVALGIVVVPREKLLRASHSIQLVLKHGVPFSVYRSLCGLLEHLLDVNLLQRNVMQGLYAPHSASGASSEGPDGHVKCDGLMRKQFKR